MTWTRQESLQHWQYVHFQFSILLHIFKLTLTLGEVQAGVRSKLKAFMKFHCAELQSSSAGMNEVNYTDLNSEIKFSLLSTSYISILNVIGMTKHLILIQIAFTCSSHPGYDDNWSRALRSFISGKRWNIWHGFFPQSLIMTEITHPSKPQLLQNWMWSPHCGR